MQNDKQMVADSVSLQGQAPTMSVSSATGRVLEGQVKPGEVPRVHTLGQALHVQGALALNMTV